MSTNKLLRQLADRLPPLPKMQNGKTMTQTRKIRVKGSEILKDNPSAGTWEPAEPDKEKGIDNVEKKQPIDPDKFYWRSWVEPIFHDHFMTMKQIFHEKGVGGVNQYIQLAFDFNKQKNPGIKLTVKPKSNEVSNPV